MNDRQKQMTTKCSSGRSASCSSSTSSSHNSKMGRQEKKLCPVELSLESSKLRNQVAGGGIDGGILTESDVLCADDANLTGLQQRRPQKAKGPCLFREDKRQ